MSACTIPATGVRPPFFTLVAVRAIAPVAGIPPNIGATMLATPCAISSMLDRCLPPIIPSATTAESSDSMAASSAIVNAGPTRAVTCSSETCGTIRCGSAALMRAKPCADRLDGNVEQPDRQRRGDQRHERARNSVADPRPQDHDQQCDARQRRPPARLHESRCARNRPPFGDEFGRQISHAKAEKILHLARENDHRYSAGETDDDRDAE